MRLLSLGLERYGPFTDRVVRFRPDARLHVVLGPNEAGKSSALAAVTDLLFGIDPRTRYAFLHEMPQMRVGAEIAASDGRRLSFRRRKGNRNTLVDAADSPLPDDALAPFLGGLTRAVFCRAFGLDARALRDGAAEMLDSEGELGASLFAAASGLRGYAALQRDLDEEAGRIFAPRASQKRSFYQALERYDAARKAIRDTGLRAGDWLELNGEIAAAATRLDGIKGERERIAAERARLERLKRVGPLLAEIDDLAGRAEADPGLVEAGEAWIARLGTLLDALRTALAEDSRIRAALASARAEVEAIPVDAGLTERADEILEAFQGIDRFDKDGVDLPRIQGEADRFGVDLDRLAARIGLSGAAALVAGLPSDAARTRVECLARDGRILSEAIERLGRELAGARSEHDGLTREVAEGGVPVDPGPLRDVLKGFAPLRAAIADHGALDATIRRAEQVLRGQAARLSPPVADVARLAESPLPSSEAVTRFRALLDGKDRECQRGADRAEAAAKAVAGTRQRLREREAGRPIATRADLARLRSGRDRGFAPLREALSGGAGVASAAIAAYERALHEADRLADDLAADAARVAEQAADLQRLPAEEAEEAAAARALAVIEAEAAEGLAAWREAWQPLGIVPTAPAEMAAWLTEADALIEALQDLDERRIDRAMLSERIEAARTPLAELGRSLGLDGVAGLDVGLVLSRLEERIAALANRWDATREANARIRAVAAGIARLETAHAEAQERHRVRRGEWAEALAAIGLGGDARPEEAESALEAWRGVPTALAERENRLGRVSGIRRDMETFRTSVAELVATTAPDLAALPPSAAIRTLQKRLDAARTRQARREELERLRDEAERSAGGAHRALDEARAAMRGHLGAVLPGLDIEALPEIEALHARFRARSVLRTELAGRRGGLLRATDGVSEASLRADLAALSPDAIESERARLAMEDEEHDQRGRVVFADRDRSERRREELEGGTGAELALAQKKAAEADLQAEARQWAVLRLANLMLGTAIGRQRAGQQDPLLTRAGGLFSALTGGGFSGLAQDYDETDTPRLAGRRASGELVPVPGLSEGTRDQLYLALRLAYLEDYATRAEPAPFIGDDLFSTFDDARTAHGLAALAAIGASVQPILFTHHRHVADLARDRLGPAVDVLEL